MAKAGILSTMWQDSFMAQFPPPREWTVTRHNHDLRKVRIVHSQAISHSQWVAKLRSQLPALRVKTPADLLDEVRRTKALDLGVMSGREAHNIAAKLRPLGFDVQVENASYVSYSSSVAGGGLIIEDDAEAQAFCLKLLQEGARLELVEVD